LIAQSTVWMINVQMFNTWCLWLSVNQTTIHVSLLRICCFGHTLKLHPKTTVSALANFYTLHAIHHVYLLEFISLTIDKMRCLLKLENAVIFDWFCSKSIKWKLAENYKLLLFKLKYRNSLMSTDISILWAWWTGLQ